MTALALALALFAQDAQTASAGATTVTTAPPPGAEAPASHPTGAPSEDYPFVAWCYGALRGYLDLHDQMIPEVRRIEAAFRPPGRTLAEDMKVYADQQAYGKAALVKFQSALTAAEKASLRPINQQGANAVRQGRAIWNHGEDVQKRTVAQMWMSWALPAKCETVATSLEQRATLMGATFKVNSLEEAPAEEAAAPEAKPE
ncbi:hypothetical protein [Phenylobacterium sp. J367]|uniref:hypothetical protein n=1 Tax=Phenylobacterium sp. J367 TaxID=2898435 RepID=UPI0021518572|nr:hypothetical protein [Phenylobacterium sp. J367]MCR5878951.1 hypothetical protein [Phenylobacterium sp. J367]